jgi:hypothetical protein
MKTNLENVKLEVNLLPTELFLNTLVILQRKLVIVVELVTASMLSSLIFTN